MEKYREDKDKEKREAKETWTRLRWTGNAGREGKCGCKMVKFRVRGRENEILQRVIFVNARKRKRK